MSSELLASKIVVQEEAPSIRSVPALLTAVASMTGVTERGPIGSGTDGPERVTSFEEFRRKFGGFTLNADLTLAAQGYFENGGQFLTVNRTVHYSDIANAATKISAAGTLALLSTAGAPTAGVVTGTNPAPFDLEPGDTVVAAVDGNPDDTATLVATAASVTSANTETFALTDLDEFTFEVDNGVPQTIIFNTAEFADIANATAAEVAAVINAEATGISATVAGGAVIITSDARGTDSDLDTFTNVNGTPVTVLGFTALSDTGTGNVADINAVTFSEIKTILEAALTSGSGVTVSDAGGGLVRITSNTTGVSSSIAVNASSTADDELGLDNATHTGTTGAAVSTLVVNGKTDGAYANDLSITVDPATSGEADHFNLIVLDSGAVIEIFPNVQLITPGDGDFVETVINDVNVGSNLIAVVDQAVAISPAAGTFGPLAGGDDGLAGLADSDFTGDATGGTGLRALDGVQDLTLLLIPGQATSAIHNAMISYGETTRDKSMFSVLDPPSNQSANQIITYVETTASLLNASEFAAIYWPRVKTLNPDTNVFGDAENIDAAPSGIIAGVYARTDASRPGGIYQPPAGVERGILKGVVAFETEEVLEESKRDLVYPKRINPLTTFPGARPHIDGTKTLKGDGNFPTVAERRGVIFIEQSIKGALQFARHSNNTPELRSTVERTVEAFLLQQMNVGAFRSTDPASAFSVDFGEGLNPPSEVLAGRLTGRIGLATNRPADFVILKFAQDLRALEEELANAGL